MKHLNEPLKKGVSISVNQLLIYLSKEKEHHVLINIHEKVSRVAKLNFKYQKNSIIHLQEHAISLILN